MSSASNRFFAIANPLLLVLALCNIALTAYCCTRYYAYLPTSDSWIYVGFLASAAEGNLDISTLFDKHNGIHVIALPKLVYFLDVWLTQGSGALTMAIALTAQAASALIACCLIARISSLCVSEKRFLGLVAIILLLSAAQAESLMNPANLQWALLVFSALFTATFLAKHLKRKSTASTTGLAIGVVMVGLTSASPLLALIPLLIVFISLDEKAQFGIGRWVLVGVAAGLIWLIIKARETGLPAERIPELSLALVMGVFKVLASFSFPPAERLAPPQISAVAGILMGCAVALVLQRITQHKSGLPDANTRAFCFLLLFALTTMGAVALARFYDPNAFTFRFVNIGFLFLLALLVLMTALKQPNLVLETGVYALVIVTAVSVTAVNLTESAAFGYGRNHVRLNQVAYALDIRHPPVVAALPGTIWEKQDYDFVQANKHKLREKSIGIYSDARFRNVGEPIAKVFQRKILVECQQVDFKIRRLEPGQRAYKISAPGQAIGGETISAAYFVDSQGLVRGFAIPVVTSRNFWTSFWSGDAWAGFANLDDAPGDRLQIYAYGEKNACVPLTVVLPDYVPPVKKKQRAG